MNERLEALKELKKQVAVVANPGWTAIMNSKAIVAIIEWIEDIESADVPTTEVTQPSKNGKK